MKKVGLTTTVPVEVVYAAGMIPVDLNNIFITSPDPGALVLKAEAEGMPRNLCSWVKGIFSSLVDNPDIDTVIAVTEGDCANTLAMLDVLASRGMKIITFAYPFERKRESLDRAIAELEKTFGVTREETGKWKKRLDPIRKKALKLDEMTWKDGKVTGFENHLSLISCSDFESDPDTFEKKLDALIEEASQRPPREFTQRIGFCGVPTIFSDLYEYLEEKGSGVLFNEMQRQFAMPGEGRDIVEQYLNYTYPYSYRLRLEDIKKEVEQRQISGVVHYIQSFCHHQIHDRSLKEALDFPVLSIEGDKPGPLRENSKIRLESFLEMLELRKARP